MLDSRVHDRDERPAGACNRSRVLTPHQAGTDDRHTKAGRGSLAEYRASARAGRGLAEVGKRV